MRFLLILAAVLISSQVFAQNRSGTICYFSLNNHKEQKYMQNLATTRNKKTGSNIQVVEYMTTPKGNPQVDFERMVKDNAKCDALVISGHHYGEWDGVRTNGGLTISFLEKMACDPRYENWFKQINSLHLQGCRTIGAEDIVSNNPNDHTIRVNAVATEDDIDANDVVRDLNYGFSNLLSKSNVLSSRYLKVFPRATTFGWSNSAPTFGKSEMNLLDHIAHMARINKPYTVANEQRVEVSNENAAKLADAVLNMIHKPASPRELYPCEDKSIAGWEKIGGGTRALHSFAHDSHRNPQLEYARQLGCKLKNAKTSADRKSALEEIIKSETLIGQNFNYMIELMQGPHRNEVARVLSKSPLLEKFVGDAVNAPNVGLFVKIDYYSFYKKVFGRSSPSLERIINGESLPYLRRPLPSDSIKRTDAVRFNAVLNNSMVQNEFITESFMRELASQNTREARDSFIELYNKIRAEGTLLNSSYLRDLEVKLKPLRDSLR
jgi:hypothetical protein